jgi:hypothetical protein
MSEPNEPAPALFTVSEIVARVQGDYLFDYAAFSGTLREYVVAALEMQFKNEPNDLHRRAFALGVYREEYTAYEDLGAFMEALLGHAADPATLPMERLLRYGPGEVRLERVFKRHNIETGNQLFGGLDLESWIPEGWTTAFPDLDLTKALRRACHYVVEDCWKSQKAEGVSAFNKIKHGGLVVPDGRRLIPTLPSAPAAVYLTDPRNHQPQPNPVTVMAIVMTDESIEQRLRQVHFLNRTLRLFVLLFMIKHHPEVPQARGIRNAIDVFRQDRLTDILQLVKDLASTPWEPDAGVSPVDGGSR